MQPMRGTLVARRIILQIQLVILFCLPEFSGLVDLRGDRLAFGGKMFLCDFGGHSVCDFKLSGGVREYRGAVLWFVYKRVFVWR
jgi:hypothetical protein